MCTSVRSQPAEHSKSQTGSCALQDKQVDTWHTGACLKAGHQIGRLEKLSKACHGQSGSKVIADSAFRFAHPGARTMPASHAAHDGEHHGVLARPGSVQGSQGLRQQQAEDAVLHEERDAATGQRDGTAHTAKLDPALAAAEGISGHSAEIDSVIQAALHAGVRREVLQKAIARLHQTLAAPS